MRDNFALHVVVIALAMIMVSMVAVLLYGLFDQRVDNNEIFKIIGLAFNQVCGAFIGILSAKWMEKKDAA